MILEICANNLESALAAQNAGAHRIELCSALSLGGLTPSYGLIELVRDHLTIPIMVLVRPRSGNFTYSYSERKEMLKDIEACKKLGVAGVVCGALNAHHEIDPEQTKEFLEAASGFDFTFHRAFDWTPNPYEALDGLMELGVSRVLTSGQQITAEKGLALLRELKEQSQENIEIMPGGSINVSNVHLFKEAGFKAIHCSASERIQVLQQPPKVSMESTLQEGVISYSSEAKIRAILKQLS